LTVKKFSAGFGETMKAVHVKYKCKCSNKAIVAAALQTPHFLAREKDQKQEDGFSVTLQPTA